MKTTNREKKIPNSIHKGTNLFNNFTDMQKKKKKIY